MGLVPLTGPESPSLLRSPDLYASWGFWDNGRVRVVYARVSRQDQRLKPQYHALLTDGYERIFEEKVSSKEDDPPIHTRVAEGMQSSAVAALVVEALSRSG